MGLEEFAKYAQIIKTAALVIGVSGVAYLLIKARGTLGLANKLSGKPTWKALQHYIKKEYPVNKAQLEQLQETPERYQEGIFNVEKKGERGDFSTYVTKRTQGLVELIEEGSRRYKTAASLVENKSRPISRLRIRTDMDRGIAEFPRALSNQEKTAILNHRIAYEDRYSCYDEGEWLGLLQGWSCTLEVLSGPNKGLKLGEGITV